MDTARSYHQLAMDCLKMAEAARDPATQDEMIRLAQLCMWRVINFGSSASPSDQLLPQ